MLVMNDKLSTANVGFVFWILEITEFWGPRGPQIVKGPPYFSGGPPNGGPPTFQGGPRILDLVGAPKKITYGEGEGVV